MIFHILKKENTSLINKPINPLMARIELAKIVAFLSFFLLELSLKNGSDELMTLFFASIFKKRLAVHIFWLEHSFLLNMSFLK
jgi:hypothetical protein